MARPRKDVPGERFNVTLPGPVAQRVRALAEDRGESAPATIATLVVTALTRDPDNHAEEETRIQTSPAFQAVVREKEELAVRLMEVRRQLADRTRGMPRERAVRWAWPLDALLADDDWWQTWLPRLYELLGRDVGFDPADRNAVDGRGYVDLMTLLFPPIGAATWRAVEYGSIAATRPASAAAGVWEPVVRHVALALAAVEAVDDAEANPYWAMLVQSEITGPWLSVLRRLLGEPPHELVQLLDHWRRLR